MHLETQVACPYCKKHMVLFGHPNQYKPMERFKCTHCNMASHWTIDTRGQDWSDYESCDTAVDSTETCTRLR